MKNKFEFEPIAEVECSSQYRYEAPRQAVLSGGHGAIIRLAPKYRQEQMFLGLSGFERIWVIFIFHLNDSWKPQVHPPYQEMNKVGVYASRSPYRPNQIGMSCVELLSVHQDHLKIRNHDLLNRTPVVDIKPYIPYADSFEKSRVGWLDGVSVKKYEIKYATQAETKSQWVGKSSPLDVKNFVHVQLSFEPTDVEHKRIRRCDSQQNLFEISYRTWRILYRVSEDPRDIEVLDVWSGYSKEDLSKVEDPHQDKDIHREFLKTFQKEV